MAHQPIPSPQILLRASLAAALLTSTTAWTQNLTNSADNSLRPIKITAANSAPVADVAGFGDVSANEIPISTTVIGRGDIERIGARRLADMTSLDASVTDSYNAPGYWDFLNIRGYTLNQSYNYRREGLPISAETMIALDNKESIEILKGTSGIQAGTSAPGGLVNYLVKRPTEAPLRELTLGTGERSSRLVALDLGGRSENKVLGYRLNIAHEELRPLIDAANGHRDLLAFAADARINRQTVLSAEFEWSQQSQPSVPAQSLLGAQLPVVSNPNINLNNQPWSLPNHFTGLTGTIKLDQVINDNWTWQAVYGSQQLKSDDRLAYPAGCSDPVSGIFYADRYCPPSSTGRPGVGLADIYQFQSDNERRHVQAGQVRLQGKLALGGVQHQVSTGILRSALNNRFGFQADASAPIGQATTDGKTVIPAPSPPLAFDTPNTNRNEYNTELFLQDLARWTPRFSTWAGLRQTTLARHSVQTDGTGETRYRQSFTTPWLGASFELAPQLSAYASWGRGIESNVAPNRPNYSNAGFAIPAAKSIQKEIGIKQNNADTTWHLTYFDIRRPALYDQILSGTQNCPNSLTDCRTQTYNGDAHHRGLELAASTAAGPWRVSASAMLLRAVLDSSDPQLNGHAPTNVPRHVLRAHAQYQFVQWPGVTVGASLIHEGVRMVVDNSDEQVSLPAWSRIDAVLGYQQKLSDGSTTQWRLGVDNLTQRHYWRESPISYGLLYLYPGAARTVRLTMKTMF